MEPDGVTLYSGASFTGREQELGGGSYAAAQIVLETVRSARLSRGVSLTCYELDYGDGRHVVLADDCGDIPMFAGFSPGRFVVSLHAEGIRGSQKEILPVGVYGIERLRCFERVYLPRGLCIGVFGNEEDSHTVRMYGGEDVPMDARLDGFTRAVVYCPGVADVSPRLLRGNDATDGELSALLHIRNQMKEEN